MKTSKRKLRGVMALVVIGLLLAVALAGIALAGCDEEECLVWGENCTQQYLLDNYGTTEIYCCEGQCSDHGSGILTCGA
jgi:hypothetical protein